MIIINNRLIVGNKEETIIGWFDETTPLTQNDIDFSEQMVEEYKAKIVVYEEKAANSTGSTKGAYKSHLTKARKDYARWLKNLAYQIEHIGKERG